jgi:transmembrane sensor
MTPIYPGEFGGHAPGPDEKTRDLARQWVVRKDRGLSPAEQSEFDRWRQADPRHEFAWDDARAVWGLLDAAAGHRASAVPPRARRSWPAWLAAGVGLAASLAVAYVAWWPPVSLGPETEITSSTEVRMQRLSDGTTVYLRPGAEVTVQYTNAERRLLLLRGTAHFDVAKNAEWPFIVRAGTVEVRAVGTAFNVFLQGEAVEVSVTEGKVKVTPDQAAPDAAAVPLVQAGERAVVSKSDRARPSVRVSPMSPQEMAEATSWNQPLMPLNGSTLAQLAEDYRLRTGRRIVIADPEIGQIQFGGALPGDDPEGFVWLLQSKFGIESERTADGTLVLRKAR